MDPLSVAASTIALCQAVKVICDGMRYIASIRNAPVEFLELQNQLQTLQGYLTQLHSSLDAISAPTSPLPPPDLNGIAATVIALENDIQALEKFSQHFRATGTDSRGRPRISKLKWRREMSNIAMFREKILLKRYAIVEFLCLLQPTQNLAQASLILNIKDLTENKFADLDGLLNASTQRFHTSLRQLQAKLDESLEGHVLSRTVGDGHMIQSELHRSVDQLKEVANIMLERNEVILLRNPKHPSPNHVEQDQDLGQVPVAGFLSAIDDCAKRLNETTRSGVQVIGVEEMQDLLKKIKADATESHRAVQRIAIADDFRRTPAADEYRTSCPTATLATNASPLPQAQSPSRIPSFGGSSQAQTSGTWHLECAVRPRCPTSCKCQCHALTTIRFPSILSRAIGTIILNYNSIPVWNSRPCNHPRCLARSTTSVHLHYLFPNWMPRLALALSVSWSSVTGSGASLYLRMPRTIPEDSEIFRAIETNNVSRVQMMFSSGRFSPTDISENGVALLTYALYMVKTWPVAKLLFDLNPQVSHRDHYGNAPISIASWKYYVHGHHLGAGILNFYQKIIASSDEESHSTVIHDTVVANNKLAIEEALNLEPTSINAMDNFGMTALQWGVLRNNVRATEVILSWHPDLELCDYDHRVALHRAAEFGLMECATMLIDAGAKIDAKDAWGDTPVHLATTLPSTDMMQLLLSRGAQILGNRYGRTPMHGSVFGRVCNDESVLERMIDMLSGAGADINARDGSGMTPIIIAVEQSHVPMFNTLLRRGAKVDGAHLCSKGRTIYHISAMFSGLEMVQTLRSVPMDGIDPDLTDDTGLTAMDYFMERLTLTDAELSEGRQRASSEELDPFAALILEARGRYKQREHGRDNSRLGLGSSTDNNSGDTEVKSSTVETGFMQESNESEDDMDSFSDALEYI